jgi:hypothetical protein
MPTPAGKYQERHDFGKDGEVAVVIEGREIGRIAVVASYGNLTRTI